MEDMLSNVLCSYLRWGKSLSITSDIIIPTYRTVIYKLHLT